MFKMFLARRALAQPQPRSPESAPGQVITTQEYVKPAIQYV